MEKKPFVLFEMKRGKGKTTKRMRAPLQFTKKQCEWLEAPRQSSPESALAIAVLQRAVMDLFTPGVRDDDRKNAELFINGAWGEEHERNYPFSFSRIVEGFTEFNVQEFRESVIAFSQRARLQTSLADNFRFQRGA